MPVLNSTPRAGAIARASITPITDAEKASISRKPIVLRCGKSASPMTPYAITPMAKPMKPPASPMVASCFGCALS
jgi:hypothetical protein